MSSEGTDEKAKGGEADGGSSGSGGGGGSKLVLILTLVNTLVTVGIIAILFVSFKAQKNTPSITDMKTEGEAKSAAKGEGGEHGEKKEGGEGGEHGKAEAKKTSELGKMVTLEQFTVNLSTPGSSAAQFVRVNVSLEVPNEESESEVMGKMPQIRNAIIDLFNSKRVTDLSTVDGRDYLREEIKNALNGLLAHGKVRGVFFTNFVLTS